MQVTIGWKDLTSLCILCSELFIWSKSHGKHTGNTENILESGLSHLKHQMALSHTLLLWLCKVCHIEHLFFLSLILQGQGDLFAVDDKGTIKVKTSVYIQIL